MDKSQTEEYIKCRQDPIYFLKKYGKVRHPTKGLLPFALWDFQEETVHQFLEHSYNIILKARQLGISTLCAGYIAWMLTFFAEKEIYILATKAKTATNLVTKVKTFIENLPAWLRPAIKIDNRQSLVLTNGSQVQASGTTQDAARSEALSLLVIDEAAFVNKLDDIWTAAQPTLATGGDCIALSTPNGMGNWFHKYYSEAESGVKHEVGGKMVGFNPIKLHWSRHPDRTQHWADNEQQKIGTRAFAQEHDCDFLQSGANVVDYSDLSWYIENPDPEKELVDLAECPHIREPLEKTWMDKGLWIWRYPDPGKQYMIAADTARGDGEDFSTFQVLEMENYEQVAEYKGKLPTNTFAQLVVSNAINYNNAFVIPENTGIGHSVCMKILELEYRNMFWTTKDLTKIHQENVHMSSFSPWDVPKNAIPGFTMSSKTRPQVIARFEEDIRKKQIILHSKRLFDEVMTFVFENGKPQAMDTYNDDLIMAIAIAMYVRYSNITLFGSDSQMSGALIENMAYSNSPFEMGIYSSIEAQKKKVPREYTLSTQQGDEDLRWLI
jgi:hypothetical protein